MKSARNNEIDLLLRKLGRRNSDGSANSTVPEDLPAELEAHLDADELSAYAEDALPASARAHYTEHLADCTRCRKIVSQLAVSAGSVKPAANVGPEQQTFRQFFASLFAPAVLRYVVPSLAAVIVLGMALMVMRYRTPPRVTLSRRIGRSLHLLPTCQRQLQIRRLQRNLTSNNSTPAMVGSPMIR